MSTPIIGPNDKRTKVVICLPVDAAGEPAFDEDGKPIAGREPVQFTVPRFDFMPRKQFKSLMATIESVSGGDGSEHDRSYDIILATLRPFVDDTVYALLEDMPMGVLEQVSADWNACSSVPLGELRASTSSSKTTKARSTTTSSDTD